MTLALLAVLAYPSSAQERAFNYYEEADTAAIAPEQLVFEQPPLIKVYESTFNEFIDAVEPIQVTGRYKLSVTVDLWILGTHTITLCDSSYTATVSDLDFDITSANVQSDGDVNASWCGFSFGADVDATGDIYYYNPDHTVRFNFTSASIQPSFNAFGYTVWLPVHINIAPTLNIPPVRVGTALIYYESAAGQRQIYMDPQNVTVQKRNGYIELQSDVSF
jgi:hypothetical protein